MKILVFGKTGQLAQALAAAPDVFSGAVRLELLDRAAADLGNLVHCAALIGHTDAAAIINAAAFTSVPGAEAAPDAARVVNVVAPGAMAAAAAARGLPFLHVSSDYVFDGFGTDRWTPDSPTRPINCYGRTKRLGELAVQQACQQAGSPFAIVRTSWVISAYGRNFLTSMLDRAASVDSVSVVSDQIGGPTPAPDLAAMLLVAARRLASRSAPGGIYHYAGAPDSSWADLARAVFKAAGRVCVVKDIASADWCDGIARPLNSRLDCTGVARDFGLGRPDWRVALPGMIAARSSIGRRPLAPGSGAAPFQGASI